MLTKYKIVYALLYILITLLISCSSPKSPITEARNNYLDHDYARAFNKAMQPAIHGDAEAQYAIGYMYYYGLGVAKDQDIARIWIIRSANKNYGPAVFALKKINHVQGGRYFQSII